jgi:hypothetical protein
MGTPCRFLLCMFVLPVEGSGQTALRVLLFVAHRGSDIRFFSYICEATVIWVFGFRGWFRVSMPVLVETIVTGGHLVCVCACL